MLNYFLKVWSQLRDEPSENVSLSQTYPNLLKFFEALTALPTSSAGIEQTFSLVKLIKNRLRGGLAVETIESPLLIAEHSKQSTLLKDSIISLIQKQKHALNVRKSHSSNFISPETTSQTIQNLDEPLNENSSQSPSK